jgi:hypothetical protein
VDEKDSSASKRFKCDISTIHQSWEMELPTLELPEGSFGWFLKRGESVPALTFPQITHPQITHGGQALNYENELNLRVREAYDAAANKPFSQENLGRAKRWLRFRGLAVDETATKSDPTVAQQIVRYLRGEVTHGFHLYMPGGHTVALKGLLLLVAIARCYDIEIIVFSTRRKPIQIIPATNKMRYTAALLRHQDSILSLGAWYPLGLAENWTKKPPTIRTSHVLPMTSPPATQRPPGQPPKRQPPVDYKSIGANTFTNALYAVM